MMKRLFVFGMLLAVGMLAFAQAEAVLVRDYEELTDTKPHDGAEVWGRMRQAVALSWGSVDARYKKFDVPEVSRRNTVKLTAWRGERVHAQAVLWTNETLRQVRVAAGDLRHGAAVIPSTQLATHFVRYVMTDEYGESGCGHRENKADFDSSLVADVLDVIPVRDIEARSVQPVWVSIDVPRDTRAGKYTGQLTVTGDNMQPRRLNVELTVVDRTLPRPQDWTLHLDLWQNPYAVARYYDVPLWSKEHFDRLRPIMKMLASVGQRSITTSIMDRPWAGQTYDPVHSMVTRIKHVDGTWSYDYTVFDRWVSFMMDDVGISDMISCYTMIPWDLRFDYFDQATNTVQYIAAKPGDRAYTEYWGTFLRDFAKHLRAKGWFDKTAISMDERPMEAMREAIKVIKDADPEFKITLAGDYHPEIQADLYYLSIPYGKKFPADVLAERRSRGQISTVYTCCTEQFPNIFTFSPPAEAAWTAIHALAGGYDGYLRWSVCGWTKDPLRDSRHSRFAAGDCYSIYPGLRSSIRFERLREGLQDCAKIDVLRRELKARGAKSKLRRLDYMVSQFTPESHAKTHRSATETVTALSKLLNTL